MFKTYIRNILELFDHGISIHLGKHQHSCQHCQWRRSSLWLGSDHACWLQYCANTWMSVCRGNSYQLCGNAVSHQAVWICNNCQFDHGLKTHGTLRYFGSFYRNIFPWSLHLAELCKSLSCAWDCAHLWLIQNKYHAFSIPKVCSIFMCALLCAWLKFSSVAHVGSWTGVNKWECKGYALSPSTAVPSSNDSNIFLKELWA